MICLLDELQFFRTGTKSTVLYICVEVIQPLKK